MKEDPMAKVAFRIVSMTIWVTIAATTALKTTDPKLPGNEFFNALPESEQPEYLSFELGRGYKEKITRNEHDLLGEEDIVFPDALHITEDLVQKFEALETPENFTQNLFEFVKMEFNLGQRGMRTLIVSHVICFENGECIDLNDIGALCCPF